MEKYSHVGPITGRELIGQLEKLDKRCLDYPICIELIDHFEDGTWTLAKYLFVDDETKQLFLTGEVR